MMHLVQRQPEKLVVNVETSVHNASLPEKINYCAEKLSAHAYTDISVDRHRNYWKYFVSIDGQLKGLRHD